MTNKERREKAELDNLFKDPKYVREVWRHVGNAILTNPATISPQVFTKDGTLSAASSLESYSYDKLSADLKSLGKQNREPTELEMILMCQIVKARTDTSAAIFIRDTLGARPVDESKIDANVSNPYEHMTDEELELLQSYRAQQLVAQQQAETLARMTDAKKPVVMTDDDASSED